MPHSPPLAARAKSVTDRVAQEVPAAAWFIALSAISALCALAIAFPAGASEPAAAQKPKPASTARAVSAGESPNASAPSSTSASTAASASAAEPAAESGSDRSTARAAKNSPERGAEKAGGSSADRTEKRGAAPPVDPLERIRDRLAQRIGAAPGADNPNVLRVAGAPEPRTASPGSSGARPKARTEPAKHTPHWDYQGESGPEHWADLKPEFSKCANGTRQSPIDIRDGIGVQLDPVQFDYKPSGFKVLDNGHTIQVNVTAGNTIEVTGRRYELLQFHFHRPSEERIGGRQFDMVAHLVHKDLEGRLAVVAVLLERGSAHPLLQQVWNNLPLEKGDEVPAKGMIDLNALLPAERGYFTYMGSLTTPPCSEGVLWLVMQKPVPLSPEQVNIFARLYPMNARPLQAAAGRLIKQSN
jgi:carbonic anhydrase